MQAGSAWILKPVAEMSTSEFGDWCQLLESRSGMVLTEQRRSFLQVNLTARMRELGVSDYADYYQQVLNGPSAAVEWTNLLDKLTVQETHFFRHQASYDFVAEFLRNRMVDKHHKRPLSLWSVGCATGEEPWSLAITVAQVLREQDKTKGFAVTATDISHSALKKARTARYSARRLETVSKEIVARYFVEEQPGCFQVNKDLMQRVCFARLNVLELAHAPISSMDVIFCQNLLIYFRRWQRREILNHLAARLAPGGVLVVGLGEVTGWEHADLQRVENEKVLAFTRRG